MKIASKLFTDSERQAVEAAVSEAEQGTTAEIVPVLATCSGRYDRSEDLCGVVLGVVLVAIYWWVGPMLLTGDWIEPGGPNTPLWPVLALFVVGFILGAAMSSRLPALRLLFLPKREMMEEVERAARAAFQSQRVRATREATGVLVYVSLYEHQVMVLGDDAVADKLGTDRLEAVVATIVTGMRNGKAADGLCQAVKQLGEHLREVLPGDDDHGNELHDGLIVLD